MAEPLATWLDVQASWRPLTAAEQTRITARIAYASALVRTKLPAIDRWIDTGRVDPAAVAGVVVDAVILEQQNLDHKITESSDDYSFRRADAADGILRITDSALVAITPPPLEGTSTAGTLVLGQEDTTAVVPQTILSPADYTYRDGGFA